MCEDLAGWHPKHLLNIRGEHSWVDLKHGHPLHLTVSLRITPAASHSRWQVPVSPARWVRGLPLSQAPRPPNNPSKSLSSFTFRTLTSPAVSGNKVGGIQWFHRDNIPLCWIYHIGQLVVGINLGSMGCLSIALSQLLFFLTADRKELDHALRDGVTLLCQDMFFFTNSSSSSTFLKYKKRN